MLFVVLGIIFLGTSFVLLCILRAASEYDQMVDDIEQEKFVKELQSPDSNK